MNERFHYDEMSDSLTIERTEDITPVLDANKRQYNQSDSHFNETFNHVAKIPTIAIEKWCKLKGVTYYEFMNNDKLTREFLNDPDNKFFRTKPGRI